MNKRIEILAYQKSVKRPLPDSAINMMATLSANGSASRVHA